MHINQEQFYLENPICGKYADDPVAKGIFDLLCQDEHIIRMIDASEAGRPALAPLVKAVEEYYEANPKTAFDLAQDFPRTVVGRMVKFILQPFGYRVTVQRDLSKAEFRKYFKSASCYAFDAKAPATLQVKRTIVSL